MNACSMREYPLVNVDGSVLEGGGQILRMSIALSALTGVSVRVFNIRAGRSKPGLAAQHLKGIELVRSMCGGKLQGSQIGSTEVTFRPGQLKAGAYYADTQTAGSISLLMQIAIPCAIFADGLVSMDLKGGTNADMAPQVDYTTEVFRPNMEKFGASFNFDLSRRGYFPRGGGHAIVDVKPVRFLNAVNLTNRGLVDKIIGWSYVSGTLPIKLADTMCDAATRALAVKHRSCSINIECYKETPKMASDNASGIILVGQTSTGCIIGGSGLGKRDIPPIKVGLQAAQEILDAFERGACVDNHIQDQLILFMALATGTSSIRVGEITLHTKTAIHIVELLTHVRFKIIPDDTTSIIECEGLGLKNPVFEMSN